MLGRIRGLRRQYSFKVHFLFETRRRRGEQGSYFDHVRKVPSTSQKMHVSETQVEETIPAIPSTWVGVERVPQNVVRPCQGRTQMLKRKHCTQYGYEDCEACARKSFSGRTSTYVNTTLLFVIPKRIPTHGR